MDTISRCTARLRRVGSLLCILGLALLAPAVAGPAAAAAPRVVAVSPGLYHTCARTSDGAAWCWGHNATGQLGDGALATRTRPVRVTMLGGSALAGVTDISAGWGHTCARTTGGAAWCWGDNDYGQLGDGTIHDRRRAVRVTRTDGELLTGVTAVAAGDAHSCARTSDGAVWCWGWNGGGGLGDGTFAEQHRAVRVVKAGGMPLGGVTDVDAGYGSACARTSSGAAWCWGWNENGQLGDGSTTARPWAVRSTKVGGVPLAGLTSVSAGANHSCARRDDGAAWCWGGNFAGALGDGTTSDRRRAVRVTKEGGRPLAEVSSIDAGDGQSCARTSDGAAWCWGRNPEGQVGDGTTTGRRRAVGVTTGGGEPLDRVTLAAAGGTHSCARTNDGAAWCWGRNDEGQIGDGSRVDRHQAVRVVATWATP